MSLLGFIFGDSNYDKLRGKAERFFLAGKLTEEDYIEVLKKINNQEELDNI